MNVTFLSPSRIVWPAGVPTQTGMLMDDSGLDAGGHNIGGFDKDTADQLPLVQKAAIASPRIAGTGRVIRHQADTSRKMAATGVATPDRKML